MQRDDKYKNTKYKNTYEDTSGKLAMTLCARGGLYIGVGVVPRLDAYFMGPFAAAQPASLTDTEHHHARH